jgi:hypothetical protein
MKPHAILRKLAVRSKYIPVSESVLDDLIKEGLLQTVPLTNGGRAIGITLASVLKYQKEIMKIEALPDDAVGGGEGIAPLPRTRMPKKNKNAKRERLSK